MHSNLAAPPPKQRARLVVPLVALSLVALLALAGFIALTDAQSAPSALAQSVTSTPTPTATPTPAFATTGPISSGLSLRTYGYNSQGAGDYTVIQRGLVSPTSPFPLKGEGWVDNVENAEKLAAAPPGAAPGYVEDKPYTDIEAPTDPQHPQAPRHDHITWNPVIMSEVYTRDENQRGGLYNRLFASSSGNNTAEKVFRRHWYEPDHLDKDQDASGDLTNDDIHYPAIMQEYTYGLIGNQPLQANGRPGPEPVFTRTGVGTFVFPIGQRASELIAQNGSLILSGAPTQRGRGLTSFDADFDGFPDITHVESERSLYVTLNRDVALDFNGNSVLDGLDTNPNNPLIPGTFGDELLILRLDTKTLDNNANTAHGNVIQFLDHVAVLRNNLTSPNGAQFDIYWTGSFMPRFLGTVTLGRGDAALANVNGGPQVIRAFNPLDGTSGGNLCRYPGGPWFIYLEASDAADNSASVIVGRALGATHAPMEAGVFDANDFSTEPWWLKRMYVDGHEYNTVHIGTRGGNFNVVNAGVDANPCAPDPSVTVIDDAEFTSITIREPVCKGPDVTIFQHSVILECYLPGERLPSLPPYNHEHYTLADVQQIVAFTTNEDFVPYLGPLVGPLSPIQQDNGDGPIPYTGAYPTIPVGPYNDPAANSFFYVQEDKEPQFLGELSERYAQAVTGTAPPFAEREWFYSQQFWTLPWEFTAYILPNTPDNTPTVPPGANPDRYLLTSSFIAPQGEYRRWTYDDPSVLTQFRTPNPEDTIRDRAKFWFDPDGQGVGQNKIYKDANGIRIYGRDNEGPGATNIVTNVVSGFPIEVPYYTDWLSIFDPRGIQAPPKDSLTLNPAYMAEFRSGTEPLSSYYGLIATDGLDARQKVFPRIWYEPDYLDKILRINTPRDLGLESEGNNTCQFANPFNVAQFPRSRYNGSITPAGDVDVYRFTLTSSELVAIYTQNSTGDPVIQLYNTCDGGSFFGPIPVTPDAGPGAEELIRQRFLPGTYYIVVSNATGPYQLVVDVDGFVNTTGNTEAEVYKFPAVMQEYTYMFLDVQDKPATTAPGGRFFFPTATDRGSLPLPPAGSGAGWSPATPSHGAGLTTFDTNFDGVPEVVNIENERSLAALTGINVDFNGNGLAGPVVGDLFNPNLNPVDSTTYLDGDEFAIFRTEGLDLIRGSEAQFMDYMVRLINVDYISGRADLQVWYTGGGLHPVGNPNGDQCQDYSKHPDFIRTITLNRGEMAIVDRNSVRRIPAGGSNTGETNGAWFVYVQGVSAPIPGQPQSERVSVILGRALGAAAAPIDNGNGSHALVPPHPWYLKRMFVDGHEYNITAVLTDPTNANRFKAITVRTPTPKPCDFVNFEDSIVLQGYFQPGVTQFGVDTNLKPVLPPFNVNHSVMEDVRPRTDFQFARTSGFNENCTGDILGNRDPLTIRIVAETIEPRFFGELKEQYAAFYTDSVGPLTDLTWSTEQFNTQPDHFTDLSFPAGEYYLLTSSWESKIGRLSYRSCDPLINSQASLAAIHPPFYAPQPFPLQGAPLPMNPVPFPNVPFLFPYAPPGPFSDSVPYWQASGDYTKPPFVDSTFFDGIPGNEPTGPASLYDDISDTQRVQFWYTPTDAGPGPLPPGPDRGDIYVNTWVATNNVPTATPTATVTPTRTPTATATVGGPTPTPTATSPVIINCGTTGPTPTANPQQGATVRICVGATNVVVGQEFDGYVFINNVTNLAGLTIRVNIDNRLQGVDLVPGTPAIIDLLEGEIPRANNGGSESFPQKFISGQQMVYSGAVLAPSLPQSGSGVVFRFRLRAVGPPSAVPADLSFAEITALDMNIQPVNIAASVGTSITISPSANVGVASGKVRVQGRSGHNDVVLSMGNTSAVSAQDGTYNLVGQPGTYEISSDLPKYLPGLVPNVSITQVDALNNVQTILDVVGGDANSNGVIDIFDLVIVAGAFDTEPPSNPQADINGDGKVNLIDLTLVGANYGKAGVQVAVANAALKDTSDLDKAAAPIARIAADAPKAVKKGEEFKVAVNVRNARNLFGAQFGLTFDANTVEIVDADADAAGVQGTVGELLRNAYVAANKGVDGKAGLYRYGATLLAPDKAVDGDGTLVTVTFRALTDGAPNVQVVDALLTDGNVNALPSVVAVTK